MKEKKKLWRKDLVKQKIIAGIIMLLGSITALSGDLTFMLVTLFLGGGLFFSKEDHFGEADYTE